jgi:membrane protein
MTGEPRRVGGSEEKPAPIVGTTYPESLDEVLAELSNRPQGGGLRDRLLLRAADITGRVASRPPWSWMAEITWGVIRCDLVSGGSALAAALAYRLFVVLLPLTLVFVSGIGLYSSSADESAGAVVHEYGLVGFAAHSVAQASEHGGTTRWYALGFGSLLVLYECYALLRALRAVHSVLWGIPVERMAHAFERTMMFVVYLLILLGVQVLPSALRQNGGDNAVVAAFVPAVALAAVVWIGICRLMPGRRLTVSELLPSALMMSAVVVLLPVLVNLVLVPQLSRRSATYGALGIAAVLLLALYIFGRLVLIAFALTRVQVLRAERRATRS